MWTVCPFVLNDVFLTMLYAVVYLMLTTAKYIIHVVRWNFQRWAPLRGFHHSHLLPTDRGWWSDEVGDGSQPREGFQLPSEHWEWEGDWMIDINFQGEVISDPEVRNQNTHQC